MIPTYARIRSCPSRPVLTGHRSNHRQRNGRQRTVRLIQWQAHRKRNVSLASSSRTSRPVTAKPIPKLLPFSSKEANDPSGQAASPYYDPPLCGNPSPLGAYYNTQIGGVNFAIFSSSASNVWLVLLTVADLENGSHQQEILLDPIDNRTGDIWHIALPNIKNDRLLYGYKIDGNHQEADTPEAGHDIAGYRHDKCALLLDPYGTTVIGRRSFGQLGPDLDYTKCLGFSRTWSLSASSVPTAHMEFDWQGDQPLNIPLQNLIIYEMHVRGFTKDDSSQVTSPGMPLLRSLHLCFDFGDLLGTYRGVIEKLDYLKNLGINCIELMPVQEFNELEYYQLIPGTKSSYRFNFWGYSTVNYFSPMSRYSAAIQEGGSGADLLTEFKTLVRECHKRGIEVIMDVVYNHTAEGNHKGPTLSFRGIDNRVYYMLAPAGEYYNYSGCGNTFNCNHPVVGQFILDSLRYWVMEMHVDGFRFDLASILTRAHSTWHTGEARIDGQRLGIQGAGILDGRGHMESGAGEPTGTPLSDPAVIAMISEDPILRNTKLIAEAWDCDGLNQVGAFPHYDGRWAEWNGTFRDVTRNFIKGTDGTWSGDFAAVLCGSPDLYFNDVEDESNWWRTHGGKRWSGGRGPMHSVNFITAHDGFSLADLVSFNQKHNEANGEDNRDGEEHNFSWNSGSEGPTTNRGIKSLRRRQMRNFLCALLLSHGVPMIVMGDEYGHTKYGNNNTYCHDDELNWFNWNNAAKRDGDLIRFTRQLIRFRLSRSELCRMTHVCGDDITWHGDTPQQPDWSETSRFVAYSISTADGNNAIYVAFNSSHTPRTIELPQWKDREWEIVVDTGNEAPFDILVTDDYLDDNALKVTKTLRAEWIGQNLYPMLSYSCIVLITKAAITPAKDEKSLF